MSFLLRSVVVSFIALAGCAAKGEVESSSDAVSIEESATAPVGASAESLRDQTDTAFHAEKPGRGKASLVFQVDGDPTTKAEGDTLESFLPDGLSTTFRLTAATSPVLRIQMQAGDLNVGTYACTQWQGAVIVKMGDKLYVPTKEQPCSITISKAEPEVITDPHEVSFLPKRMIYTGYASAIVTNPDGTTHDVRAGFTLPKQVTHF